MSIFKYFSSKSRLIDEIEVVKNENKSLLDANADIQKAMNEIIVKNKELESGLYSKHNDNVSIDFRSINAFSIERLYDKDVQCPITVVGYKMNDQVYEWNIHVTEDKHLHLVEEFNLIIKG